MTHYREILLMHHVIPAIWRVVCQKIKFISKQDSTPAHRARDTRCTTPHLTAQDMWPLNSPHLNPVDCATWSVCQQRVYENGVHDVDFFLFTTEQKLQKSIQISLQVMITNVMPPFYR